MYTQPNSFTLQESQRRSSSYPSVFSAPNPNFNYFWQHGPNYPWGAVMYPWQQPNFCPCPDNPHVNQPMYSGKVPIEVSDANWSAINSEFKIYPQSGTLALYSPNGKYIASVKMSDFPDETNNLIISDGITGKILHEIQQAHTDIILSIAFSPDGEYIASGSENSTVALWEARTGEKKLSIGTPSKSVYGHDLDSSSKSVTEVAFSLNGKFIAYLQRSSSNPIDKRKDIKVWNIETGQVQTLVENFTPAVNRLMYNPQTDNFIASSDENRLQVWDVTKGTVSKSLEDPSGEILDFEYSLDGKDITFLQENKMKVWNVDSGSVEILIDNTHSARLFTYSPDRKNIALANDTGMVVVVNVATGKVVASSNINKANPKKTYKSSRYLSFPSLSYSPNGKRLALGNPNLIVWEVEAKEAVRLQELPGGRAPFAYNPMGTYLAAISKKDINKGGFVKQRHNIEVWNVETGKVFKRLEGKDNIKINSVAYSTDGASLAFGSSDKTVKVWNLITGEIKTLNNSAEVNSVAYSPLGQFVAFGSDDSMVKIWDVVTGKVQSMWRILYWYSHQGKVNSVAYSPDGRFIASGSDDKKVKVWDVATGGETSRLEGFASGVTSVAYSPDGRSIAAGSKDNTVKIWSIDTGEVRILPHAGHSVAYSPDRKYFAASNKRITTIWNISKGKEVATLTGSGWWTRNIAFNPASNAIAYSGYDILIWST